VLRDAQVMIERMEHRGGWSCDNDTGDGAGVLTGIPHELYAAQLRSVQKYTALSLLTSTGREISASELGSVHHSRTHFWLMLSGAVD